MMSLWSCQFNGEGGEQVQIIMGLDPGSRKTGFGLVRLIDGRVQCVSHGVIHLHEEDLAGRLLELGESLRELTDKYRPHLVVIERVFLGKNVDSAFKLGHARGVCLLESRRVGAEVVEYSTREVKKGVTGSGAATKEHVEAILSRLMGIQKINQLDASDALALAWYHATRLETDFKWKRATEIDS